MPFVKNCTTVRLIGWFKKSTRLSNETMAVVEVAKNQLWWWGSWIFLGLKFLNPIHLNNCALILPMKGTKCLWQVLRL
tara:strand:+ start:475 stop:708 length:234 start_codon:yes stop_codon:yes gene_type:complete